MKHRPFSPLLILIAVCQCALTFAAETGVITDPKAVLAGIPREVMQDLRPNSPGIGNAVVRATAEAAKNAKGKPGSFKIVVRRVDQFEDANSPGIPGRRVVAVTDQVREGGTVMRLYISAIAAASEHAKADKLRDGAKVTVQGEIYGVEVMNREGPELHLYLQNAMLK